MRNAKIQIARLHSLKEFDFSYDPLYHILWEFRAGGHGNSSHNTTILVLQMPQKSILVMVFVNFTGCSLFDKYLTFLLTYLNIAWELLSTTLKWSKSLGKNSNRKTKRKSSTEAKSSDLFPSFRLILNSDRFKEPLISLLLALWMAPL